MSGAGTLPEKGPWAKARAAVKVLVAESTLDYDGTVTRFRVKSWSLSDSAFLVRTSSSRTAKPGWIAVCGRLELHASESEVVREDLAALPPGSRSRILRRGRSRMIAIGCLAR